MKEYLILKKIQSELATGELGKEKVAELLISLLETSENTEIRVSSIKILEKINFRSENIFKILENYLISDENAVVRASVAKYLFENFLDSAIPALKWIIQHEKSPLVLKIFFDSINRFDNPQLNLIKKDLINWNKIYASKIGIDPQEARFFLDLESLFAKDKQDYEINPFMFKHFQKLSDIKNEEPWLVIKSKHVEILNFNYFNWKWINENLDIVNSLYKFKYLDVYFNSINEYHFNSNNLIKIPETIGKLRYLKKLILKRNNLNCLPESIGNLTSLKELDLSYNEFYEIPQIISAIKSLEKLNFKANKIQKISEEFKSFLNSLKKFKY